MELYVAVPNNQQLHKSMKEAVAIATGDMQPFSVFTVKPPDGKPGGDVVD
jgi:hypothetical protein